MPERRVIFYSWQSDLPNSTNRGFIQNALAAAAKAIASDDTIDVEPVIDRDTAGVPGSPDIASTIFAKIDAADVVVLDVSIITDSAAGRPCPNPNVLVELGYAVRAKSWDNVLLVMNTAYGAPPALPFDLRMRRTMTYGLADGAQPDARSEQKQRLQAQMTDALRAILQQHRPSNAGVVIEPDSPALLADKAMRSNARDRRSAIRRFGVHLLEGLSASDPGLGKPTDTFAQLTESLATTTMLVAEFARLAVVGAELNDQESILELHRTLEPIASRYDMARNVGGTFYYHQFDYWRFIGHELFLTLVAPLVRDDRWEMLGELLSEGLYISNRPGGEGPGTISFDYHARRVMLAAAEGRRLGQHSPRAELLRTRHDSEPLKTIVSFEDLCAADFVLFLRSELPPNEPNEHAAWWADVFLLGDAPPPFLHRAARVGYAERLATALGLESVSQLRERLLARHGLLLKDVSILFYRFGPPVPPSLIESIGTRP